MGWVPCWLAAPEILLQGHHSIEVISVKRDSSIIEPGNFWHQKWNPRKYLIWQSRQKEQKMAQELATFVITIRTLIVVVGKSKGFIHTEQKRTRKRNFHLIFDACQYKQQFLLPWNTSKSHVVIAFAFAHCEWPWWWYLNWKLKRNLYLGDISRSFHILTPFFLLFLTKTNVPYACVGSTALWDQCIIMY